MTTRRRTKLATAVLLVTALLGFATMVPADASGAGIHYKMNAKTVAKKIGCKGAYRPKSTGDSTFHIRDGVVCLIKGRRVNVITFNNKGGQTRWENFMVVLAAAQGSRQHWASADGVVIVAKNGNKGAACAGERALRGARHVDAYWATAEDWHYLDC